MRVYRINQARLEALASNTAPLKMGTQVSYNEIAALVAEVYEWRRKFGHGAIRAEGYELPVPLLVSAE